MSQANAWNTKDQLQLDPASTRKQAVLPKRAEAFRYLKVSNSRSSSSNASLELDLKSDVPDEPLTAIPRKENKFVSVRLYSTYEYRSSTLMFKMKLSLSPEGFEEKDPLVTRGYRIIGNDHFLILNCKSKNLKVSLLRFAYPEKLCVLTDNGCPIYEKMFNDVLLWKEKAIKTEFCFVFDDLERKDVNNFYCKGAFNISHGEDVLAMEFSFFVEEKIDAGTHNALTFGTLDINQVANPCHQKVF